ncbi:MAG: bifunctional 2-polyprenyl-6-hydroxyphenol methylase/3-demethylubiquinol 3-O-methyltransferase UbiG [Zoogloeaceae bacterium]|nr:bifunctional 2-polyprenyl-6-hydroxyphenol methylase/3-demethylubiquinol 3-O-methyltransferase UbiG [Zoogloeaceae bacterium]
MSDADPRELAKFDAIAQNWWDPHSEFRVLHEINPLRLDWIAREIDLAGKTALDVGCGGGLLAEGLAARGARVTGIDLSEKPLGVARLHLLESGLAVDYRQVSAETLARELPGHFDVVTCLEMLEHTPDPQGVLNACAQLLKPGGKAFFSTLNRNPGAFLLAIVGAEYVLNILPKGTHDYAKFIRPSELARYCRAAGLEPEPPVGMSYNPFTRRSALGRDIRVNYLMTAIRRTTDAAPQEK